MLTQVSMANLFWLSSMESKAFHQLRKPFTPFQYKANSVNHSPLCQAQAKHTFDLLTHYKTKLHPFGLYQLSLPFSCTLGDHIYILHTNLMDVL